MSCCSVGNCVTVVCISAQRHGLLCEEEENSEDDEVCIVCACCILILQWNLRHKMFSAIRSLETAKVKCTVFSKELSHFILCSLERKATGKFCCGHSLNWVGPSVGAFVDC